MQCSAHLLVRLHPDVGVPGAAVHWRCLLSNEVRHLNPSSRIPERTTGIPMHTHMAVTTLHSLQGAPWSAKSLSPVANVYSSFAVRFASAMLRQGETFNVSKAARTVFGFFTATAINKLKEMKQMVASIYISVSSIFSPRTCSFNRLE